MKIRVVLADTDECYIQHFTRAMKMFYFNEVEVVAFSVAESLQNYIKENIYDILLASVHFPEVTGSTGVRVGLVESKGIKEVDGVPALCKYQRIDNIHKELLNIMAEEKKGVTYSSENEMETPILGFTAAAGGVGKTTVAMTYARAMAAAGYQVLYLSLENFTTLDSYFKAEGDATFSNVIFSVKCGKGNLQLKIQSAMRMIYGGIYYLAPPSNPEEVYELGEKEWTELCKAIKSMGKFHCVVLDLPDMMSQITKVAQTFVDKLVVVTDGKDMSTVKTKTMVEWCRQLEKSKKMDICSKMVAVQNKSLGVRREMGIPLVAMLSQVTSSNVETTIVDTLVNSQEGKDLLQIYVPGGEQNV